MKEKIGKLLELLNEYCMGAFVYDNDILRFRLGDRAKIEGNAILISKSFGFIKWLVENEKIDKSKVFSFIDTADKPYEDILCLLALSDEPIEDLISFLKDD